MSPQGFKARVGSALFELCGGIHDIPSLRFTSGTTPLPVYIASIAAGRFPHMRVSAEVGCRILQPISYDKKLLNFMSLSINGP